jgi:2,3-bisphosphoglycerate-independent phosphoglycerate mutase
LSSYGDDFSHLAAAYAPSAIHNGFGEYVSGLGLKQLRIAETEKYAHVTFFLNGGREQPFVGEDRILVPSPKVATYDLQPEMSLPELSAKLCAAIRSAAYDVIFCNIANPDMVGHTGVFAAAVQAVEAVDLALGQIRVALQAVGGELLVTADHGNLEMMRDPVTGAAHTQHTIGPVPLVYCGRAASLRSGGALKDLAPTLLAVLGQTPPAEMTGVSLITFTAE